MTLLANCPGQVFQLTHIVRRLFANYLGQTVQSTPSARMLFANYLGQTVQSTPSARMLFANCQGQIPAVFPVNTGSQVTYWLNGMVRGQAHSLQSLGVLTGWMAW